MALLDPVALQKELAVVTYLRLFQVFLSSQGIDLKTLTIQELSKLTGIYRKRLQRARDSILPRRRRTNAAR